MRIFAFCLIFISFLINTGTAQDLESIADEFYNGLADIIERNMNNPDQCVIEIDSYYQSNQDKVLEIRREAQKAMELVAPQMDKYMSMTEEEAAAMERHQMVEEGPTSQMNPGATRYTNALKMFSSQYPKQGAEIAMKGLQLAPGFSKQN